jgi:hypothetical protein
MWNPDVNTKLSKPTFMVLSIVISVAVAYLAWFIIGYCPRTPAQIDALTKTWFWAGQACANQQGDGGGTFAYFGFIWLIVIQTALNAGVLLPTTRTVTKYISVTALAIVFFLVYMLMFVF